MLAFRTIGLNVKKNIIRILYYFLQELANIDVFIQTLPLFYKKMPPTFQ